MQNINIALDKALNENNFYFKVFWTITAVILFVATVVVKIWPLFRSSKRIGIYSKRLKVISFPLIALVMLSGAFGILQQNIINLLDLFNLDLLSNLYAYLLVIMFIILMTLYLIIGLIRLEKRTLIYSDYTKGTNINFFLYKEYRELEKLTIDKFLTSRYPNKYVKNLLGKFKSSSKLIKEYEFLRITKIYLYINRIIIVLATFYVGTLGYFLFHLPFKLENLILVIFIAILMVALINTVYLTHISMKNYDHLKYYREENDEDHKEG